MCTCTPATFAHPFEMCDACQAAYDQREADTAFVEAHDVVLTAADMRALDVLLHCAYSIVDRLEPRKPVNGWEVA